MGAVKDTAVDTSSIIKQLITFKRRPYICAYVVVDYVVRIA